MCHAVDAEHNGRENASVVYIAACPSTPINRAYIKEQLNVALGGLPPPDYADTSDLNEATLEGYTGYKGLGEEAKQALGFYLK
jgi:hypothetical protein